jgi:hypothetical protein
VLASNHLLMILIRISVTRGVTGGGGGAGALHGHMLANRGGGATHMWPGHSAIRLNPFKSVNSIQMNLNLNQTIQISFDPNRTFLCSGNSK